MRKTHSRALAVVGTTALAASLAACSGGASNGDVTLQYWMWDDLQVPAYQACAEAFTEQNPTIKVDISQSAWGQYWTNLSTQIAAGSAPDVWVNQASYYPQFVDDKQIVDIQPMVERDGVDTDQYVEGMAELWARDDARYGLPKDWDTMGLVYNRAAAAAAGFDEAALSQLTWNPDDGGTFEKFVAAMSVDSSGRNGLDPNFNPRSVKVYGFLPEWADGSQGQNGWANFAFSNGWTYADQNPFGTEFNYADEKLTETVDWMAGLSDKGFAPALDAQSTLARAEVLLSGTGAMTTLGSFNMGSYADVVDEYGFAPLPIGPEGRKSAINGLSDAIYAGSPHQDEAWEWVKFLASSECQDIVGETGVVFPAIPSATAKAAEVREAQGLDAQVFIDEQEAPDGTFIIPISLNGTEISQIVQDAIQSVALGSQDAKTALTAANDRVNALFK